MKQGILCCLVCSLFLIACNDDSCIKCTPQNSANDDLMFCEDSGFSYTDQDGNDIPFEEIETYFESLGYDCD